MDLPSPELRPIGHVECAFCGTVVELKANKGGVEVHYHGKGLYADGVPERLAKFHERTIKSFVKERENIKELIERYIHHLVSFNQFFDILPFLCQGKGEYQRID